jgi:hypothetical protein
MVSLPVTVDDYSAGTIFPAASSAFGYSDGYATEPVLKNGSGYWIKCTGNGAFHANGARLDIDTIDVKARWNMVGSISAPVAVANITSPTFGLTISPFYQYDNRTGYTQADTVQPGKGYWVKSSQDGKLVLSASSSTSRAAKIRIVSDGEQPPPPPSTLSAAKTLPKDFALKQNYPNPFNPSTIIEYQLPTAVYVSLKVYNMLGQEIATLVEATQEAGYKSIKFDIANLPSGVYIYSIVAGSYTDAKKMLLMR